VVLLLGLIACTPECGGPACESAWPATTLFVLGRSDLVDRTSPSGLVGQVLGTLPDGASWSVLGGSEEVWVGMPERGAVARIRVPTGAQRVSEVLVTRLERQGEAFGNAIARVDTDGDGTPELWVGAPDAEGGRGAVYRFQPDALDGDDFDLRWVGGTPADALGEAVFGCGDVTGDGLADVVAVAPWFEEPTDEGWTPVERLADGRLGFESLAGAVFLLASETLGAGETRPWMAGPTWWGPDRGAGAGGSVACREDVTNDQRPDIVIGAPFVGSDDAGMVFVREGGSEQVGGRLDRLDAYTIVPRVGEEGQFGASIAVRDRSVAVGAPTANGGSGSVLVYEAVPRFPGAAFPSARFDNERSEPDHFGQHVVWGDLDGDALGDLWVGAPDRRVIDTTNEARTRYDTGAAWVWLGAGRSNWTTELTPSPDHTWLGEQPFARVGRRTVLTDLDNDGLDEILQPVRAADPDL
jgi:hypothetical protein